MDAKVLLLTPVPDSGTAYYPKGDRKLGDEEMAHIIGELADIYKVGLVDVWALFDRLFREGHYRSEYAVSVNHPGRKAHELVADSLMDWIPYL